MIVTRDAGAGFFIGTSVPDPATAPTLNASAAIKVTSAGKFSGSVLWDGKKLAAKGAFDETGKFTKVFAGAGPRITLALDRYAEAGSIRVSLQDGTNTAQLQARPQIEFGKNGQFNAELRLASGVVEVGTGWASGKLTAAGTAKFVGVLPDGTPFSFGSASNIFQDIPFLSYVYSKAHRGAAIGALQPFAANTMVISRPASPTGRYTAGFSESFSSTSKLYIAPPSGTSVLPFPTMGPSNGSVQLSGGGLASIVSQNIFLATIQQVSVRSARMPPA